MYSDILASFSLNLHKLEEKYLIWICISSLDSSHTNIPKKMTACELQWYAAIAKWVTKHHKLHCAQKVSAMHNAAFNPISWYRVGLM